MTNTVGQRQMGAQNHLKIVRNRVPDDLSARGRDCECETLSHNAFVWELADEVVYEAGEVANELRQNDGLDQLHLSGAPRSILIERLATLKAIIDEIQYANGITTLEINDAVCKPTRELGSYSQRLYLVRSSEKVRE